jgi:hypothetical protein
MVNNEDESSYLTDCNGRIMSHCQLSKLTERMSRYYEHVSDDNIAHYNDGIDQELEFFRKTIETTHREEPKKIAGFVYFLQGGGYVKIGIAKNIDNRLEQIKPQLPFVSQLLHVIKTNDTQLCETQWHRHFQKNRTNGEWFKLNSMEISLIKETAIMTF